MLFKTPVIAYNSSNIKNTLNGGGILFYEKSFKHIAGVIELVRTNTSFKREVLETQKRAIEFYKHENIVKAFEIFK
jgi:glycosyltransferase involved in cell wall biosynthesis